MKKFTNPVRFFPALLMTVILVSPAQAQPTKGKLLKPLQNLPLLLRQLSVTETIKQSAGLINQQSCSSIQDDESVKSGGLETMLDLTKTVRRDLWAKRVQGLIKTSPVRPASLISSLYENNGYIFRTGKQNATQARNYSSIPASDKQLHVIEADINKSESTELTVYSDHAIARHKLEVELPAEPSQLGFRIDPDHWRLHTVQLKAKLENQDVRPEFIHWKNLTGEKGRIMNSLLGKTVNISVPGHFNLDHDGLFKGILQKWDRNTAVLASLWGQDHQVIPWSDTTVVIYDAGENEIPDSAHLPTLAAMFRLEQPAEQVEVLYTNSGVHCRNQYKLEINPPSSTLALSLNAYLENNSETDYNNTSFQLASVSTGYTHRVPPGRHRDHLFFTPKEEAFSQLKGASSTLFTPLPGKYDLPAGGGITLPVSEQNSTRYTADYKFDFASRMTSEGHPEFELTFVTQENLPQGEVQISEMIKGEQKVIHRGFIPQTTEGRPVKIRLGQDRDISVQRKCIDTRNIPLTNQEEVEWLMTISNNKRDTVTVIIEDTGNLAEKKMEITVPGQETKSVPLTGRYWKS